MKFHNEYDYLLHLLACALNGTQPEDIPEEFSFAKVLKYGKTHEVANIAFLAVQKLKTQPEPDILNQWNQVYWQAVKRDVVQKNAREETLNALHSHGIYTLEVQGTVVKKYYPQSHLRMMSDIDIIVPEDKLSELEPIMQSIGYETKNPFGVEVDARKGNAFIELHTEFFDDVSDTRVALEPPFTYAEYGENYTATVSDTVFYLFHLLHTIKHCGQKGSGLRRIIDLYYLEKVMPDKVDYNYIDGVLKKYGFYETKVKLIAVKDKWFNGIESDMDLSEFETEILQSGNHGTEELSFKHKFKKEKEQGKRFPKLLYLLAFLFPPKEDIYVAYPFCQEHNYPIILCWVHRWIFSVLNQKKWKSVKKLFSRLKIKTK